MKTIPCETCITYAICRAKLLDEHSISCPLLMNEIILIYRNPEKQGHKLIREIFNIPYNTQVLIRSFKFSKNSEDHLGLYIQCKIDDTYRNVSVDEIECYDIHSKSNKYITKITEE
jgi:hypothetical protein